MKDDSNDSPLQMGNKSDHSGYGRHYRICPECNKSFYGKNLRAVYCSDRCKVNFHRKMKRKSDTEIAPELAFFDTELKRLEIELDATQTNQAALVNEKARIGALIKNLEDEVKHKDQKRSELAQRLQLLHQQHGKPINTACPVTKTVGTIGSAIVLTNEQLRKSPRAWLGAGIVTGVSYLVDRINGDHKVNHYNHSEEILRIQRQLMQALLPASSQQLAAYKQEQKKNLSLLNDNEVKAKRITNAIDKVRADKRAQQEMKPLAELKDEDGLVDFRDLDKIDFADRVTLAGDLGYLHAELKIQRAEGGYNWHWWNRFLHPGSTGKDTGRRNTHL